MAPDPTAAPDPGVMTRPPSDPAVRTSFATSPIGLDTRNGTGRTLLGIVAAGDGTFTGTVWQTRAYLPVRPISRHRFRVLSTETSSYSVGNEFTVSQDHAFEFLEGTALAKNEVRKTYLLGWVVAPLVLLLPGVVSLVYTLSVADVQPQWVRFVVLLGPLVWLSLGFQSIANWLDKRIGKLAGKSKHA